MATAHIQFYRATIALLMATVYFEVPEGVSLVATILACLYLLDHALTNLLALALLIFSLGDRDSFLLGYDPYVYRDWLRDLVCRSRIVHDSLFVAALVAVGGIDWAILVSGGLALRTWAAPRVIAFYDEVLGTNE